MGDYDRKPMDPPSIWLKLKSKGEVCRFRIGSSPYRELKVWPAEDKAPPLKSELVASLSPGQWSTLMRDPNYNISEVFHFAVIDRADGAAKIFTTTGGVYGKVRDYATNVEWGDPKGYDLSVERTENPGKNYYEVTPSPNKSDLTMDELNKIDALKIADKVPAALPAASPQPDDLDPNVDPQPLPWAPVTAAPAPRPPAEQPPANPDVVIEDVGDDPINLDDIPFK